MRTLVDNGVRVHVFGKGWENLKVKHPENLILNGRQLDSAECVKIILEYQDCIEYHAVV